MYFLMIRPQRRRAREQKDLQTALQVGNEVVTTSGIFGKITGEFDDNTFWLEIDDDVQIRIARAAIQGKVAGDTDDDSQGSDDESQGSGDESDADDDRGDTAELDAASDGDDA